MANNIAAGPDRLEDPISMHPEGLLEERPVRMEIDKGEALDILELMEESLKRGYSLAQTYRWIGRMQGRNPKTIENFIRRNRSTVEYAKMKLRGAASDIVDKIIDKAPTHELIDILSRPNIGVLDPIKKVEGGGGFILNVSAESCGAVKIGVVHNQIGVTTDGIPANAPEVVTVQPAQRPALDTAHARLWDAPE